MDHRHLGLHDKVTDSQPTFPVPTSLAYSVAVLYLTYQLLIYLDFAILPPQELLWNALVYLLPAQLLLDAAKRQELREINMLSQTHAAKSDALRTFFTGAGQPLLLQKLSVGSLSRQSSGLTKQSSGSNQPPGLGNWDNSCYQNSVLQGLASLDSLKPFLHKIVASESASDGTGPSLQETINELNSTANNGRRLWTPAKLKSMSSWQQQDAQEYFSKIMDELDKEAGKTWAHLKERRGLESIAEQSDEAIGKAMDDERTQKEKMRLQNPMEGYLAQRVACTSCGFFEGLSMIPFNCLTVPLGPLPSYHIDNCLDEYTKLEEISEVECAKCTLLKWQATLEGMLGTTSSESSREPPVNDRLMSLPPELRVQTMNRLTAIRKALENDDFSDKALNIDCQIPKKGRVSSTKTRQAVIGRAPQSLMVHFNRSVFDEYTGAQMKNYASVQYPLTLDLRSWMLRQTANGADGDGASKVARATQSMLSEDSDSEASYIYRLKAVVTHYGRHENGHYICYRSYPAQPDESNTEDVDADEIDHDQATKPQWWCLSDDDVSSVTQEDVLGQGGVFMLFYERQDNLSSPPQASPVHERAAAAVAETSHMESAAQPIVSESPSAQLTPEMDETVTRRPHVSSDELVIVEEPKVPSTSSSEDNTVQQVKDQREQKSSHSSGFSQPNVAKSPSTTPSQHPVMRTAGARRKSRSSLSDKKTDFGASQFRPMAAT